MGSKSFMRQDRNWTAERLFDGIRERGKMNGQKLAAIFRKWKKAANADYAITTADEYGDCSNCVICELTNRFGRYSKGIWIPHWKCKDESFADLDCVHVMHDLIDGQELTDEQIELFYEIFSEHYVIKPNSKNTCFTLYEID